MKEDSRQISISSLRKRNSNLTYAIVFGMAIILVLVWKLFFTDPIVVLNTPGLPDGSVIAKTSFDKGAQQATLIAVTSTLASITPGNAEYIKKFLSYFLSPTAYTKVLAEIDKKVERMVRERELGSHYFVAGETNGQSYYYDPRIDRHFVLGNVHTVNAAKDTGEPWVFEFVVRFENYRLWVDDVIAYPGTTIHNYEWLEAQKK